MDICAFDVEDQIARPHLCKADISTFEVARQCQGKHSCSVHATNEVFRGDPCPEIPNKYLEVVYECRVHEEKCAFDGNINGNKHTHTLTYKHTISFYFCNMAVG